MELYKTLFLCGAAVELIGLVIAGAAFWDQLKRVPKLVAVRFKPPQFRLTGEATIIREKCPPADDPRIQDFIDRKISALFDFQEQTRNDMGALGQDLKRTTNRDKLFALIGGGLVLFGFLAQAASQMIQWSLGA